MKLAEARELKQAIKASTIDQITPRVISAFGISARRSAPNPPQRTFAVGIAPSESGGEYRIAVRLQRAELRDSEQLQQIRKQAGAELDVRYVGHIGKSGLQDRNRPLIIGCSTGHFGITAGTLGGFVESRAGVGRTMILSNNHVLADENRASIGDAILQPGKFDGGVLPADVVAHLTNFEPLHPSGVNVVDCAVAEVSAGMDFVAGTIDGIGRFTGEVAATVNPDDIVRKTGRTTGTTIGKITAIELDNVVVGYEIGSLRFDDQIEIEGVGGSPFSRGGDSGSLVVDGAGNAVGLLFAGSDTGGSNNLGLTYVNPIQQVLNALNIRFVTA